MNQLIFKLTVTDFMEEKRGEKKEVKTQIGKNIATTFVYTGFLKTL